MLIMPPTMVEGEGPIIFLAGPIQGARDWQGEAARMLLAADAGLTVASPRTPDDRRIGYEEQVDWETQHLRAAGARGVVLFWLAAEAQHVCERAYAQTTRFELAEWTMRHQHDGALVVVGIEQGFTGDRYIRRRLAQDCPAIPICATLEETCERAITLAISRTAPHPSPLPHNPSPAAARHPLPLRGEGLSAGSGEGVGGEARFVTTSRGLRRDSAPMRLFEKAKRLGVWNPSDIDLQQDKQDWGRLNAEERDLVLRLMALFQSGEEAVTLDLLPLIEAIAAEGRLEEELFLTTFLFEEAKHTDFFSRVLGEVVGHSGDLSGYHTPAYHTIFSEALPQALGALAHDRSPQAQARASTTYNMIVEGVMAETGYHAFAQMLERNDLMPGLRRGIALLKQDESRHIAYGLYLLSRLVAEHEGTWEVVEATLNELFMPAVAVIGEAFACYDPVPFGLDENAMVQYATNQFNRRYERLERARASSHDALEAAAQQIIEEETAP